MPAFVCVTCGVQYPESREPPAGCAICADERQYVGWQGQEWTTLAELEREHRNVLRPEEPGLTGIGVEPSFAIGQRALLVETPEGNVLWDCVPLLGDETLRRVRELGGVVAVAISHPHYYSTLVDWARAFDAPVYVHAADEEWVVRSEGHVVLWEGETRSLPGGLTLVRCGGHFEGATVLHWPAGVGGRGALLAGDILQVVQDRRWMSFMYSYPNLIPLPRPAVERIVAALEPYPFERVYGAWFDRVVAEDGKAAVRRSADRYLRAIERGFGT